MSFSTLIVVVVVVVVAATARLGPVQNWGGGEKKGCKIAFPKSGPSARARMVEGISAPITTIHIGNRYPSGPIASGTVPVVFESLRYPFRMVGTHFEAANVSEGGGRYGAHWKARVTLLTVTWPSPYAAAGCLVKGRARPVKRCYSEYSEGHLKTQKH